jgi:hypothetical protein
MRTLVWDSESARHHRQGESWDAYAARCGISVACTMEVESGEVKLYTEADDAPNDIDSLAKDLLFADLTVSFNGLGWDWKVLANACRRDFEPKEVDLLQVIRACKPERWQEGDWTLDAVCRRTLGVGKISAIMAPTMWEKRKIGKLVSYVIRDVWLTCGLYKRGLDKGVFVGPHGGLLDVGEVLRRVIDQTAETRRLVATHPE